MSDDRPQGRGVTANAVLFAGYLCGCVLLREDGDGLGYEVVSAVGESATTVFRNKRTGNTFSVNVRQIGGVE